MTELERNKKICEEMEKLEEIFADVPENRKKLVEGLIQNASFMKVVLLELQEDVAEHGATITTMTGNGFETIKDNPAQKAYTSMVSKYSVVIRQLQKLLPSDEVQTDEFLDFINQ